MNYINLIAGTVFIILFSWFLSIRHKRYHGFARFFSFESIFILIGLNKDVWFLNPFSILQILSWIFLAASIYLAIAGFVLLRKVGKPATKNFEDTSVLVRKGLYRYIRHPLYLSLFLLGTGAMLKDIKSLQLLLGGVNMIAVYLTSRIEEKEMIAKFGEEYILYMKETKMFIPFII
jgi:protein-S-isoprenylcysteine O-methyltransferase Ste14